MIIFYYWDFLPMFLVIMKTNDYNDFFKDRDVCNIVKNMKTHSHNYEETLLPFQFQLQNNFKI